MGTGQTQSAGDGALSNAAAGRGALLRREDGCLSPSRPSCASLRGLTTNRSSRSTSREKKGKSPLLATSLKSQRAEEVREKVREGQGIILVNLSEKRSVVLLGCIPSTSPPSDPRQINDRAPWSSPAAKCNASLSSVDQNCHPMAIPVEVR